MNQLAQLSVERVGHASVVRIRGEVDMSNATDVLAAIESSAGGGVSAVVVDLTHVDYLDSAGARILFALAERLAATRQAFRLVVPEGAPIRAALDLMGVGSAVPISSDVESGLSGLE